MSGIIGWVGARQRSHEEAERKVHLDAMAKALAHRGGGDWAIWMSEHADFVQLPGPSVFELMRDGQRYAAVCDALLTGIAPLRQCLAKAYSFVGESAAELILAAYLQEGEDCVKLLDGSFAFVIWDGARSCAFAARDAFGARPLFYTPVEDGTLLASEPKALFAHPQCVPKLSKDGLREVLSVGPGRTPGNAVFDGVHEIVPGGCLRIDADGLHTRTWYALQSTHHTDNIEDTIEHTRSLLFSSIAQQWPKDGQASSLLSGGIDSSVITAVLASLAKEQHGERLSTYSFDYVNNDDFFRATSFQPEQDAPYVDKVRTHCGTDHQVLLADDQDLVDGLIAAMRARDFPGMADVDSSLLYFCSRLAREQHIAFSGECGDEIFGGYPWFHREEYLNAHTFPWNTDPSARLRTLDPALSASLHLEDHLHTRYEAMLAQVPHLDGETGIEARRREISYLNLYGFMATLVDRGDRMSAAAGIEIRTPFLDKKLVEYVFNVPWQFKALHGENKGLLRATARELLPDDVLHRRKCPFPKTHNPHYERMVQALVRELMADPNAPVHALLNSKTVLALCEAHADYGKPWFGQLMAGPQLLAWILQVNAWMEIYHLSV